MSIVGKNGEAGLAHIGKAAAGAAVILALMAGSVSGASAQCVGSYHPNSGGGAHSAAVSSGVHAASAGAPHTASSCATSGTTANAAKFAALRPIAGLSAERPRAVSTTHRTTPGGAVKTARTVSSAKVH